MALIKAKTWICLHGMQLGKLNLQLQPAPAPTSRREQRSDVPHKLCMHHVTLLAHMGVRVLRTRMRATCE